MKKNKKAQISSTISWFIATILIFLILMVFVLFAGLKGTADKKNNIVDDVRVVGTIAFLSEEEQRALFSLFEDEIESKKFYDLTKDFVMKNSERDQRHYFGNQIVNENDEKYIYLTRSIYNLRKSCINFFIIKEDFRLIVGGTSVLEGLAPTGIVQESTYEISYYFRYPLIRLENPLGYSFFFPKKSFALIKYNRVECQE